MSAVFQTQQPFIIAEAGVNHNGDLALAKALIDGAARAGADAVKFQLFDPVALTSAHTPLAAYQEPQSDGAGDQRQMLSALCLERDAMAQLQAHANTSGILFLCSPFDEDSARFLVRQLNVPCLKIGSGELTNRPLLQTLRALNTPVILSTGMATLEEVAWAVEMLGAGRDFSIALLHCVSAYPAPMNSLNLRAIQTLRQAFPDCTIGYSDHALGIDACLGAVSLGARIIEKHITTDPALPGPDHAASLPLGDLVDFVQRLRALANALGDGVKQPQPVEQDCLRVARKSLVTTRPLPAGHRLAVGDLTSKRPGTGISPRELDNVLGRPIRAALAGDQLLSPADLDRF